MNPERDDATNPRLSPAAKKVLKDFFLVYHFLLVDNMRYKDDYRVALIKGQVRKKGGQVRDLEVLYSLIYPVYL